jgi:hypothetical protein
MRSRIALLALGPRAFRRPPTERWLLHDSYNDHGLYLWEPGRERLTKLGRGGLVPVPGVGQLVTLYGLRRARQADREARPAAQRDELCAIVGACPP